MKRLLFLMILAVLSTARADSNTVHTNASGFQTRLAGIVKFITPPQSWMTNYYGKTLSSLGEIDTIRITYHGQGWAHRDLWRIIEESVLQDVRREGPGSRSRLVGLPPRFAIDYVGGMKVEAEQTRALIILPDGRSCAADLVTGASKR